MMWDSTIVRQSQGGNHIMIWDSTIFYFHPPKLGVSWSNLTSIFFGWVGSTPTSFCLGKGKTKPTLPETNISISSRYLWVDDDFCLFSRLVGYVSRSLEGIHFHFLNYLFSFERSAKRFNSSSSCGMDFLLIIWSKPCKAKPEHQKRSHIPYTSIYHVFHTMKRTSGTGPFILRHVCAISFLCVLLSFIWVNLHLGCTEPMPSSKHETHNFVLVIHFRKIQSL